jgi:MFS family permease
VYSLSAFIAIILNFLLAPLIRKIQVERFHLYTTFVLVFATFSLYFATTAFQTLLEYILFYSMSSLLFTLSSVILEEYSKNAVTGGIRGKYNAITSAAYLLAPFVSSFFILGSGIKTIFILSTFFAIISFLIFRFMVMPVQKIHIPHGAMLAGIRKIWRNTDLLYITFAQVGLYVFYISAIVYLPLKLQTLGISLTQYLSVLLPIALTPFLFMPPILGHLEDKMKDEKEILIIAYFGLIITLLIMAFCNSSSLLIWALIMFFGRFCASSADISTNSYIFKKISTEDVAINSIFLSSEYICTIAATPILSLTLYLTDSKTVFLFVSFFLCFVLVYISKLHDTKNYEKHRLWKAAWKRAKQRV